MLFLPPETVQGVNFSLSRTPSKPQRNLDAAQSPMVFDFSAMSPPLGSESTTNSQLLFFERRKTLPDHP